MRDLNQSAKALRELLSQRILVLDGAMGTMLQQANLSAQDFGGVALEGCNENLVRTRPDVVLDIHRKYFDAGADIVETNSLGCRGAGIEPAFGAIGAAGGRTRCDPGETSVCGGVHGTDDQSHYGYGRR
jgi:hypothetical protein